MTATRDELFSAFGLRLPVPPLAGRKTATVSEDATCHAEELALSSGGESIRAFWCRPRDNTAPLPAVLILHAHGNRYDIGAAEVIQGRPALFAPTGRALAARGIASLCLDMPCFGSRAGQGESAATKALLWEGRSLAGQMLAENIAALDWLRLQPEVDPDRIGVFGLSMGATLAYWLGALDPRLRAVAHECCFADFRALIALGKHDLHGIYLTVPGLLARASNGQIAGMIAPRAQFIGLGDLDPLTPPAAADVALKEVRAAYAEQGGRLVIHREPASGHVETQTMHSAMLDFMESALT
ncbi:MAG: CocE/NonD family hydrolase [Pseudotabrizicola sp.]|uniref:alpha/beta hydrolase family protein n=1 Tax=Pseudotabrizicola sp. TaxID=2939647 RepID=UPI0027169A63|nr:CocE/NonD family hydrolase [Pseudotabrizicola sp.]MDO9639965.1 CocE/NonD family hydrolase [Pseudotabrizicola sp.]